MLLLQLRDVSMDVTRKKFSVQLGAKPCGADVSANLVAPGFKNKTGYTPYVSPVNQISHIVTNKCNINRQCSVYNVLSIKNITLDSK